MPKKTQNPRKTAKKACFVAYYRISTKKQSKEVSAQKTAVKNFLRKDWPPEKSFFERESGKSDRNRPELKQALDYCYRHNATLVVAKLDRLSRDLEFIGWIQNTNINFVCCDMPQATRESIGFMGVIARWEREQISKRTKEALAEKRKQGVKLGYHRPEVKAGVDQYWQEYKKKQKTKKKKEQLNKPDNPQVKLTKAQQADQVVIPTIKVMRRQFKTFQEIADSLNKAGVKSRFGGKWHQTSVLRVADRNNLE